MSVFPGSTPPTGTASSSDTLAAAGHTALHNAHSNEVNALATKMGTGSSTPTLAKLLRGTGTGTSSWAQADLTADVAGVLPIANGGNGTTNTTGTGSVVFGTAPSLSNPSISGGGVWTGSPSLTSPTIADHTNANHDHSSAAQGGLLNGANAITDGTLTPAELTAGTGSSWAMQSYTPNWTNLTVGNGTQTSRYIQMGKIVFVTVQFVLGSTSSVSGPIVISLPVTSKSYIQVTILGWSNLTAGGNTFPSIVEWNTITSVQLIAANAASTFLSRNGTSSTVPGTWTTNDAITAFFMYEAA